MSKFQKSISKTDTEIGPADELLLVGGGRALEAVAASAVLLGYKVFVATSPRYQNPENPSQNSALAGFPDAVKVSCSSSLDEAMEKLKLKPGIGRINLALGNPWIVTKAQLETLFGGMLMNCHGTGLPRDRGGGGFSWRILESNPFGFVNLYLLDEGLDTGPLLDFEEFLFPSNCRVPKDFEEFYSKKVVEFILNHLSLLKDTRIQFSPKEQLPYLSTYWPRLSSDLNGWIDWRLDCSDLERFIRAFDQPYGGARTCLGVESVRVGGVRLNYSDGRFHPYQAGVIYRKSPSWICVAVKGGSLVVEELTDESGISLLEQVKLGDRLYSPQEKLDGAILRAVLRP